VIPHTTPSSRVATVLAALVAALALSSGGATAAPPCADAMLADWLDNSRIDRLYDLPCYEAAIDAIPHDLRDYTDAADVIARAFQNVSGRRLEERRLEGPSATDPPPPGVVPGVDASASTSVPIPLLVLGGMSVMLLAAGGFAYVARRRREQTLDD
jgi:hypothetical protein